MNSPCPLLLGSDTPVTQPLVSSLPPCSEPSPSVTWTIPTVAFLTSLWLLPPVYSPYGSQGVLLKRNLVHHVCPYSQASDRAPPSQYKILNPTKSHVIWPLAISPTSFHTILFIVPCSSATLASLPFLKQVKGLPISKLCTCCFFCLGCS